MRLTNLYGILVLFLFAVTFAGCDNDDDNVNELTPQTLYQTSWRGTGYCEQWTMKDRSIGIQFIDTQKGKVNWEDYHEFDITYTIEGKYITFNDIAFQLALCLILLICTGVIFR